MDSVTITNINFTGFISITVQTFRSTSSLRRLRADDSNVFTLEVLGSHYPYQIRRSQEGVGDIFTCSLYHRNDMKHVYTLVRPVFTRKFT